MNPRGRPTFFFSLWVLVDFPNDAGWQKKSKWALQSEKSSKCIVWSQKKSHGCKKLKKTLKQVESGAIIPLFASAPCSRLSLAQLTMGLINYVKKKMVPFFSRAGNDFRGQGMHLNFVFPYKKESAGTTPSLVPSPLCWAHSPSQIIAQSFRKDGARKVCNWFGHYVSIPKVRDHRK